MLVIDPNRSTGVPLNDFYRRPSPGSIRAYDYHDPVTMPAADIAENPYWKRDVRRNYARTAVYAQNDIAGLLTVGNVKNPRIGKGAEGEKQLVAVKEADKGILAKVLEERKELVKDEVLTNGLPPLPGNGWHLNLLPPSQQSYPMHEYPMTRGFT